MSTQVIELLTCVQVLHAHAHSLYLCDCGSGDAVDHNSRLDSNALPWIAAPLRFLVTHPALRIVAAPTCCAQPLPRLGAALMGLACAVLLCSLPL